MRELTFIPSKEIEKQISQQDHIWYPIPEDTKHANKKHWPELSFVGAYYAFCSNNRRLPTQKEYIDYFFTGNEKSAKSSPPQVRDGMYYRAGRNYRILVCEHHLLSLCIESRAFELCYKSEELDLEGTVDMVLKFSGYEAGIALRTRGSIANHWEKVKRHRREVRDRTGGLLWSGVVIPFFRDTKRMKKISNLHLFGEETPSQLAGLIQKERFYDL